MPVIAVINRKGGSGKSTLATHLAAWLAGQGVPVMLGDIDRQQSTRSWLSRRDPALPAIRPWAVDQRNVHRAPAGVTHVVLDTQGGLHGFELAKVIMNCDAVVMPVCNSIFDRESAQACLAELMGLPRVASGRCRVVAVGMRIDGRTHGAEQLRAWAEGLGLPFLGALRESQVYVKNLDSGKTVFDLASAAARADIKQWEPLLDWLRPLCGLTQGRPAAQEEPIAPPAEQPVALPRIVAQPQPQPQAQLSLQRSPRWRQPCWPRRRPARPGSARSCRACCRASCNAASQPRPASANLA